MSQALVTKQAMFQSEKKKKKHENPATSPIPTKPGVVHCYRLFEPIFFDFFKARKAGARGREEKVE